MKTINQLSGGIAIQSMNIGTIPTPITGYLVVDSADGKLKFYNTDTASWENYKDVSIETVNSQKGTVNGIATLDSGGKIPASQLPNTVMELKGSWNASTNTPTLANGTGNAGDVYEVTVAGTQNLGSGNITFAIGDFAVYGSSGVWFKSENTNEVTSVNGKVGTVVLDKTDISLSNVDNTSDINKPISTATQTALNAKYDNSNPNGYETPSQLNARDTANRARVNHTGVQLASTISDFASATLNVVITGVSFVTNSAILATDTVLQAFGKIQAQINSHFGSGGSSHSLATSVANGFMSNTDKIKLDGASIDKLLFTTSASTNISNTVFVTLPAIQIPIVSGNRYRFEAHLLFDTAAASTGITLSMGGTATGTLSSTVRMPISNTAGTTNMFQGPINVLNGLVTSTAVGATGTVYLAVIQGIFTATSNGVIYPQYRPEVNNSQARININSTMIYKEF